VTAKVFGHFLEQQVHKIRKKGVRISDKEIYVSLKENSSVSELLRVLEIAEQTGIMCLINGKIPGRNCITSSYVSDSFLLT
jgi:hypothetical protein